MTNVRVRFAPSPTGFVHVGSLRTALYNFLFAKKQGGKLVLRIEDTDQKRYVEGAVDNLLQTLQWTGLIYDEGPNKKGPFGPYFQSERTSIYRDHVDTLIAADHAYPCFCDEARLDTMRKDQTLKGFPVVYDGKCRNIDQKEAKERMHSEEAVIRLKVPHDGETIIKDIIRGEVRFQNELIDDQVLIKSDGYPTYHLANVVDDHLMQISHVIRGEEWLPSTPKHALLYQAFGWELPEFAHLPLLLNEDRSKLSKRQGDVAVEDYRGKGILPEALLNFVALLGWNRGDDQELFSLDELVKDFSLERVNKAGAVFNLDKLYWMNGQYIRNISEERYIQMGIESLKAEHLTTGVTQKDELALLAVRDKISSFKEIKEKASLFFADKLSFDQEAKDWITKPESQDLVRNMISEIGKVDEIDLDVFKEIIKNVQQVTGLKGKDLWMPVRAAITGTTSGPELPAVIQILGKKKVLNFLSQALN